LDGIWDYIAEDNIEAADQWIGRLFDAFDAIGDTPGLGHKREDLTAYPVLFWPESAGSLHTDESARVGHMYGRLVIWPEGEL